MAFTEFTDDVCLRADDIEAVIGALDNLQVTRHTSLAKPVCIENAFVAEHSYGAKLWRNRCRVQ